MRKKIAIISAVLVLALVLSLALAACNQFKWDSIGKAEPNGELKSNGGYAVKQGKYLYYINGFDGTDADNTFGTPVKQAILRSEVTEENGALKIVEGTTKIVVPKTVLYSSSVKDGGIAVFGEWIYYATPNYDKDKTGAASTTDVDFMRTKTDGSVTQKIAKISGRDTRYLFTPNRILYVSGTSVNYIDFSGMKTNKSVTNGSGAKSGTLVENVSGTVLWSMDCDRIFYVESLTGENSFKQYNNLCSIKWDGSDKKTLATENTFLQGNEKPEEQVQKVFKFTLVNMLVEKDAQGTEDVTLYYTKSHRSGESDTSDGFFCAKASNIKDTEYLMYTQSVSAVYPLGYEEGALLTISSSLYKFDKPESAAQAPDDLQSRLIASGTPTVCYIDAKAKQAYYTSSSVTGLARTSYDIANPDNQALIFSEGIKTDWLNLDFVGTNLVFFATDDENYAHIIDVKTPIYQVKDEEGEDKKTEYIGLDREEDEEEQ